MTRNVTLLRVRTAAVLALGLGAATLPLVPSAQAAGCVDVEVVFARGTGEPAGLGSLGGPFVNGVTQGLPGRSVSSYAVPYAADFAQSGDGAGATTLVRHVTQLASSCPNTKFVLGGYSQGASVVDIALGIGGPLGQGEQIPASVEPRIAAIAVFGNPGRRYAGGPITTRSSTYGDRAIDLCNPGDPVCSTGVDNTAHLRYGGAPLNQAVSFVVDRVTRSAPTPPGTTDPGTTDPGTTDPGTTDPGTTDPGTTGPGTAGPKSLLDWWIRRFSGFSRSGGSGSNGFGSNGFGSNGFGSNGFGSNGFGSNGFGSNGFGSNGFGSNGFGSNGFGSNGFGSSGFGSNGFGSNGGSSGS